MAECLACQAVLDSAEVEIGEIVICNECGADMEVIAVHPLELELIEDDEDVEEDEDDEDAEEEEEEFSS